MKKFLSLIILISVFSLYTYINENNKVPDTLSATNITMENIPTYTDKAYIEINNNEPSFNSLTTESFELYGDLDDLGRCLGFFVVAAAQEGFEL